MALLSISPEHKAPAHSDFSKWQRLSHSVKGKLLHLISGGDTQVDSKPHASMAEQSQVDPVSESIAVTQTTAPALAVRIPKARDASFNATPTATEAPAPNRMPTVAENFALNPKIQGETRADYIKRLTGPRPIDALEGPHYVSSSAETPMGDAAQQATYAPTHRADVPPDAVISQPPVDAHIYNKMQAEARPPLHLVK